MILKIAYNNDSRSLVDEVFENKYPNLTIECYNEDSYKEKRDAFLIKGSWGARAVPFAIIIDNYGKPLKAFYSEASECTFDNIHNILMTNE